MGSFCGGYAPHSEPGLKAKRKPKFTAAGVVWVNCDDIRLSQGPMGL